MNFSQSSWIGNKSECKNFLYKTVSLRYSSDDSLRGLLVAAAVLNLATAPCTIFLNTLVMVAVKTKRRLQTHHNILLAFLALTDLMTGLLLQPLHITKTIFLLQGKDAYEFCDIESAYTVFFLVFTLTRICHLLLISGERYLAIKHTFTHAKVVTKHRVIISSAVPWIAAILMFLAAAYFSVAAIFIGYAIVISTIVFLQILVYKEARRHEKQILSQQVSWEARAKFKQEKKALKLTTVILLMVFLCFALPLLAMSLAWQIFSETFSNDFKTSVRHLCVVPSMISSVFNPIIYTVRKKQFRIAFIEFLFRKNLQEATEFHRRMFGSRSNIVGPRNGQEREEQEQKVENEKVYQANGNNEHNPEDNVCGVDFDN